MNKNFTSFHVKNTGFFILLLSVVFSLVNSQSESSYKKQIIYSNDKSFADNSALFKKMKSPLILNNGDIQKNFTVDNIINKIEKRKWSKEGIGKYFDLSSSKLVIDNNEIGKIGNANPKEDDLDASDNIFKVNLQNFDVNKKYILTYEIDGYSDAASVAKSINGSYSFGGYAKTNHTGWTKITEVLNSNSLQVGNNNILFNTVEKGDFYTVKNVSIQEINAKNDYSNFEITSEKFNDDVLYFKGFVKISSGIKYIEVQNKKIELLGNEFEFFSKEKSSEDIKIKFISENGSFTEKIISKNNLNSNANLSSYKEAQRNIVDKYDFGYTLGLRTVDLPPLDQSITNVSYQYSGFKFNSTSEKNGGLIKIPYDPKKIPKGYTEKDISTFTFDYNSKKWQKIVVDSVNTEKKYFVLNVVFGESNSFISGVARQPESPENGAFTPTTLDNNPIASPASKINIIAPPSANQQGSANLQYPIEIPAGINGFQPNVSVSYNSDSKSGWLGVGWDIVTETIDIDSRWGTPEFSGINESEIYILAGEQLVFDDAFLPNKDPNPQARGAGNKRFYFRNGLRETSIITRVGTGTKNYIWEILDGSGTKKVYSELLKDSSGNIIRWYLSSVTDKYNNTINYNYGNTTDGGGVNKYLSKIIYSNNTVIDFTNQPGVRVDMTSNYKLGAKITNSRLLDKITVSRANKKIREYQFVYKPGAFSKSLLTDLIHKDGSGTEFNRHKFQYSGTTESPLFNDNSVNIATPSDYLKSGNFVGSNFSVLGGQQTKSTNFIRGAITVGFSKSILSWFLPILPEFSKNGTAGINGSYSESETFGKTQLMDIDGDGLPDKVFFIGSGNIQYRKNLGLSFSNIISTVTGITNNPSLSRTNSYITSIGVEASFKNGIGAGATYSTTKGNTPVYFSDVNGDGLPDLVNYGEVFFNKIENGLPVFISTDTSKTPNVIKEGIPAVQTTTPAESYSLFSNVVRMWEAPVTGDIIIKNDLLLEQNSKDGVDVWIEKGAKTRANEDDIGASSLISSKITLNTQGQAESLNATTHVAKGQRIFIIANSKADIDGDKVKINTEINYTGGISGITNLNLKDANDNYYFKTKFSDAYISSDYRGNIIGGKSTVNITWANLSNQFFSEDVNFRIYKIEKKQSDATALSGTPQLIYFNRLDRGKSLNTVTPASNLIAGGNISNLLLNQNSTEADPVSSFFYFTVSADSNVAWEKINWNSTMDVTADSETRTIKPIIDYQLFSENIKYGTIPESQNNVLNYSVAHEVRTYPKFTSCYSEPLILPSTIPNVSGTEVVFTAKFIQYHDNDTGITEPVYVLKKKVKIDSQGKMPIPYFDHFIPVNGATYTKVYYEIYSSNYDVVNYLANKNPNIEQFNNACQTEILSFKPSYYSYRSQHKSYNIQTGNNWQGWGGFSYNGSKYPNQTLKENEFFTDVPDAELPQDPPCSPTSSDYESCIINYIKDEQNKRYFTPLQCNAENNSYASPIEAAYLDQNYLQPYALNAYKPSSTAFSDPVVIIANPRGIIPHSSGWSLNLYGSFALSQSVGGGINGGYSRDKTWEHFIDVNGDQYPDVITGNQYQPTNQLGQLGNVLSSSDKTVQNITTNVGVSGSKSITSTKNGNTSASDFESFGGLVSHLGTSANSVGFSGSGGVANGKSKDIWLDINGDGLLDFVSNSIVFVNNGRGFEQDNSWDLGEVSNSETKVVSAGGGVNLWGGSFVAGLGLGTSTSNATLTFVDINGDGLVDKLVQNGDFYKVYYNKGNSFESLPISLGSVDVKGIITNQQVTSGYNLFGTICLTIFKIKTCISAGYSKDNITTKQTVDLRDFNGDGMPDVVFSTGDNNLSYFENIGGQYNLLTSVENPLKGTIAIEYSNKNPITKSSIGNTYQMPFSKTVMAGVKINNNRFIRIDNNDYKGNTGNINDIYNIIHYTFEYENGIQDRREREFLGFGVVKTNLMDDREIMNPIVHQSQVTEYETSFTTAQNSNFYVPYDSKLVRQYFYKKGLVRSSSIYNADAKIIGKTTYTYNYFDSIPTDKFSLSDSQAEPVYKDMGRIIPLLYKTEKIAWEYSGTDSHSKTTFSTVDEYSKYGNVLKYADRGVSLSDTSDDVVANISYFAPDSYNIFGLPSQQTVTIGRQVMRKTTTEKNALYDITIIKKYLGRDYSQYDLKYDSFGNLIEAIQPKPKSSSAESERLFYKYEYDPTHHTYLTKITDGYGYSSSTSYDTNYLFGVPVKSTDFNNVSSYYKYDDVGRLTEYRSPADLDWTIRLSYFPNENTPVAITERKAPIVNGVTPSNNYFSSVFTDGMGGEMGAKKLFDKNTAGNYLFVTNLFQIKDNIGRVNKDILWDRVTVDQDFSRALKSYDQLVLRGTDDYNGAYLSYEYDSNDRPTKIIQHRVQTDGVSKDLPTNLTYSFDTDREGKTQFTEKVVSPLGNTSISYTNEKGQITATKQIGDGQEMWISYKYDLLGQISTVQNQNGNNTTYSYDMLGRKILTEHPDAGLISLDYDLAGKLISSQNPLLKILNKKINYTYNFNQLTKVEYPDHIVKYEYGAPGASNFSAGRLIKQTDKTGTQNYKYSNLGQVIETGRTVVAPNVPAKYFKTSFVYDVYNRINKIIYPDLEEVTYNYNDAGFLKNIMSKPPAEIILQPIISNIVYDSRDQITEVTQGNGTKTLYQYDSWSRLSYLTLNKSTQQMRTNAYVFDDNSNLKTIGSIVPMTNNLPIDRLAVSAQKSFTYDAFNRLQSADITAKSLEGTKIYKLDMAYTPANSIANKNSKLKAYTNGLCMTPENEGENATYNYDDRFHPNAVSSIAFARREQFTTPLDCGQSSLVLSSPLEELYTYDANGNMTLIQEKTGGGIYGRPITTTKRQLFWDEQNRLKGIVENQALQHYVYDASGDRILKSEGIAKSMDVNGDIGTPQVPSTIVSPYTYYPNGYFVVSDRSLSKHYYIGGQKIATRVSDNPSHGFRLSGSTSEYNDLSTNLKTEAEDIAAKGSLPAIIWFSGPILAGGELDINVIRDAEEECENNIRNQIEIFGPRTTCGRALSKRYQQVLEGVLGACDAWNDFLQDDCMTTYPAEGTTSQVYWLHADELGSASILTNQAGNITNWYEYLPFGELLMEQSSNDYNNPYLYNGKELDAATGLYYYGARYYDPRTSIFQSVDPLVELTLQPYQYAYNNPVMFNDPTGMRGEPKPNGPGDRVTLIEEVIIIVKRSWFHKNIIRPAGIWFNDILSGIKQRGSERISGIGSQIGPIINTSPLQEDSNGQWVQNKGFTAETAIKIAGVPSAVLYVTLDETDPTGITSASRLLASQASSGKTQDYYNSVNDFTGGDAGVKGDAFAAAVIFIPTEGFAVQGLKSVSRVANIGRKLEYLLGKATGSAHNIERSTGMLRQLESIGIFDNAAGRLVLSDHLKAVFGNAVGLSQSNGRVLRESLLMGPNGGLKVESIWEGNQLITVKLIGK